VNSNPPPINASAELKAVNLIRAFQSGIRIEIKHHMRCIPLSTFEVWC
jgi:hypothetical protein